MRVIQILPTLGWGDAVGNDARAIHRILKEEGYDSLIGAEAVFYFANGNIADFLRADTASFAMDAPMPQEVKTVFVVAAAGYALMISVLYFIGRRLLVKGVNVD